ncbi:TldD/PmbA family protein [Deinococcus sp. QL22]|uniref:TldD/PmbA family protein n=1 Tax=Deinococcus sp. QL22 TaxID=2939437 RepID=UPI0020181E86|nr:TldD/PmbA family protein [Deinococcus sp. QL22]
MNRPEHLTLESARAYLMAQARKRGVALEVYAERSTATTIQAFGGAVSDFKLSSRQGLGLRALVNGAWGASFTENLAPPALDRALDNALENAGLSAPVPHAALHAWGTPPTLDLHGEGLSGVTVEQKVGLALGLDQAARDADPRVQSVPYSAYNDSEGQISVEHTGGLERSYQTLGAFVYAAPLVTEDGQSQMKSAFQFTREFTQLDPGQTALEATRKALALLGARPAPTGQFPVVIDAECMALLLAVYAGAFSARQVQEGKSTLAGRLGQSIGSSLVTLIDDATLPTGMDSRPFDAEGCPSAPLTLIRGGVLQSFLHNSQTAAQDGVHSTGHASRWSYQGVLSVAPSNLYMLAGQGSRADLLARLGRGLLLTDVKGAHAGANLITGDFSLQAEGFWIENGVVAYPLEVFTVAGNLVEVLSGVQAVADDLTFSAYAAGAPSVLIDGLSVGGSADPAQRAGQTGTGGS